MRVCMIVRNPCVRDARVLKEAKVLAEAGHDLVVIAIAEPGVPDAEEKDGFRIRRVDPLPTWVRRTLRLPGIARGGWDRKPVVGGGAPPGTRRRWWQVAFRDALVTRQLTRAALAAPAEVYHAHDLNTLAAALAAARRHGARLVYDSHELYPEIAGLVPRERARWTRVERRLIGSPDAVVAPSEGLADELARRYSIARQRVVMNCPPAGPAPDRAASRLRALRRDGEALLVYAGGYTQNRGLDNLIRATGLLDGTRLVMVGFGGVEGELRALAARERLGDRVVFHEPVAHEEVVPLVAGADVGLAPYLPLGLNNALAAPNKLFEYLHAGLPVAGSDLGDIRAVVEEHRVGGVFDAADPSSIATTVRALLADPDELAAMRARALAVAPRYSWQAQAAVLREIYETLAPRGA
jgi:glycosyltransferase involved in cell wall biosynthesis